MFARICIGCLALLTALLAGGAPARAAGPASAAEEIVAVERAFAAMAKERGMRTAFLAFVADDAVTINPRMESARAAWRRRSKDHGPPYLEWWPIWTGAARSGDLAFSLGPWTYGGEAFGYYFSVWRRQADGSWKWTLDQGSPLDRAAPYGRGAPVTHPAMPVQPPLDSARAFAAAARMDEGLNAALVAGKAAAFSGAVAEDARSMGFAPLAVGRRAVLAQVSGRPAPTRAARLGGYASKAGDLAVTFGEMTVRAPGHENCIYVRVWRRQGQIWRLLFDELVSRNRPG